MPHARKRTSRRPITPTNASPEVQRGIATMTALCEALGIKIRAIKVKR